MVIKVLDPDWIRIRIGVHPKMLDPDPDPDEMNTDPQPCFDRLLQCDGHGMHGELCDELQPRPGILTRDFYPGNYFF